MRERRFTTVDVFTARPAARATRSRSCSTRTGSTTPTMQRHRRVDEPVGDDLRAAADGRGGVAIGCASSRREASCRSPAIRRSGRRTPSWRRASRRRRDGVLRQECRAGVLPIRVDGERLMVRVPRPTVRPEPSPTRATLGDMMGAPVRGRAARRRRRAGLARRADRGRGGAPARGAGSGAASSGSPSRTGSPGVTLFARPTTRRRRSSSARSRPRPASGRTRCAGAATRRWRRTSSTPAVRRPRYRASQGREVGRDGRVDVEIGARRTADRDRRHGGDGRRGLAEDLTARHGGRASPSGRPSSGTTPSSNRPRPCTPSPRRDREAPRRWRRPHSSRRRNRPRRRSRCRGRHGTSCRRARSRAARRSRRRRCSSSRGRCRRRRRNTRRRRATLVHVKPDDVQVAFEHASGF